MDEADKGLTDDHDRYEWANVSSGTGHPGCPGQNLQSCKTVVCVCLCPTTWQLQFGYFKFL